MSPRRRPYKLLRTVAAGDLPVACKVWMGSFASLAAAVRAARQQYAAIPDGTYEITVEGQVVRCTYHNGPASEWTAE